MWAAGIGLACWLGTRNGRGALVVSLAATVVVEGSLFIAAVWVYSTATRATDRIGRWALRALIVLLVLLYVKFIAGPPPPAESAFAWVGLLSWLFPLWLWWIDRHRVAS